VVLSILEIILLIVFGLIEGVVPFEDVMKNALSIDLEDWYHPELVKRHISGSPDVQIADSTNLILGLLDRYSVKATFFILGDVAVRSPELIKTIYDKGHEIASHGMSHSPLWDMDYAIFDRELKDFNVLINDILQKDIIIEGFRAPTFSMENRTKYALKCLIDNHYKYDSSVFPIKNYMYGVQDAPCSIYRPNLDNLSLEDESSEIIEFPLTVFRLGRIKIPISGGFYMRVLPYFILKALLKRVNRTRPFVIYFHPWETFLDTPRLKNIGFKNRFITYYGIHNCLRKIENLVRDFEFGPVADAIEWTKLRDIRVRNYFERHADRFDSFYKEEKRNFVQQLAHVTLRRPGMVRRFQATTEILVNVEGKTILDMGCGSGIYSIYFAKKGAEVTGIDFSPGMVSLARRNADIEGCRVDFIVNDLLKYETGEKYDYSLLIGVFDYVKKDETQRYFEKTIALTRRTIVATFPKRFAFQMPIRYVWLKRQNCPVYFYTRKQIERIADEFGLRVKFYDCGPIWTVEFRM